MSATPDEILVQRQLRAAEIALEAARRQRFEADDALRTLRAEVDAADARVAAARAERDSARLEAAAEVAAARAVAEDAEQRLEDERRRRLELEEALEAARREGVRRDELSRQLAAERRVRQLEGEVELIRRRAGEFEQELRIAALAAFAQLRAATGRVGDLLEIVGPLPPVPGRGRRPAAAPRAVADAMAEVGVPWPGAVDSTRLDAALERLRAAAADPSDAR